MKWDGPDSVNSWLISLACCFINMMMFGMARLSGVLFVASIPRFNIGRKQASFPYTFASFLRNVSGPLVGYLGHKFGVRTITSFGASIGAIGAGLCFFAESIDVVTLFWGAIFGLGFGLGNVLLPIAINQYFDKHRATASGISFSGGCLGSFILPPIVDILLNNYGLSQTFLFLSGFILNCLPAALLLRKPSFKTEKKTSCDQTESERKDKNTRTNNPIYTVENYSNKLISIENRDTVISNNPTNKEKSSQSFTISKYEESRKYLSTEALISGSSIHMNLSKYLDTSKIEKDVYRRNGVDLKTQEVLLNLTSNDGTHDKSSENNAENTFNFTNTNNFTNIYNLCNKRNDEVEIINSEAYQNYSYQPNTDQTHDIKEIQKNVSLMNCSKSSLLCSEKITKSSSPNVFEPSEKIDCASIPCQQIEEKNFQYHRAKIVSALGSFSVILDPMFVLIVITNGMYTSSFVCMVTIIVDFSRDLHIEESYEKYILMLLSVGDIVGRLGLGWITDRGYMSTTTFAAVCFGCQGLSTAAIAWSNSFTSLGIVVTLYGLAQAGLIVIFPIIIAKFIDHDKQTVAIPSSHFLSGPLCLAVAPLIGYFRDEIGSYNWILYGITILSAACSVSWIFAPCIDKSRRKN